MKRRRADLAHIKSSKSQEYKALWTRKSRGSISWNEYIAKRREAAATRIRPKCSLCTEPAKAKGYCRLHYDRLLRRGDPLKVLKPRISNDENHCRGREIGCQCFECSSK